MAFEQDVAKYLMILSSREVEGEPMTNLRLQKLLYYVQGWSLAMRGNAMFAEPLEAWDHGPVVPSVWRKYKQGSAPLPQPPDDEPVALNAEQKAFVDSIWAHYKRYTASWLRHKTHHESPWIEARGDAKDGEYCQNEITHESMVRFFQQEYSRLSRFPNLTVARYRKSELDLRHGKGRSFNEIRRKHAI